ncbi:MAG: acyltransferase [Clostridiales bacterium]|nr:acyltransferase [Clostridiales bacterium]
MSDNNNVEMLDFNCTGYLRLILMLFICFWAFGCPEPTGIVGSISGFAIPAFYVLSGFYVLDTKREVRLEKVLRKIKRSALCFVFVLLFYVALNVPVMLLTHTTITISKRMILEFLVLNLWPLQIGDNIWFIQAMLYAYIVIFILDKLKLMKFYRILLVILFVFMLLTGEFSGVIRFNILGYQYIPGNWFTRALPYILLGKLLRDMKEKLMETKFWKYLIAFVIGGGLVILEIFLLALTKNLQYPGHMFGYAIMAVAACGLAISIPIGVGNRVVHFDSAISGFIYVFMNPVYYALIIFFGAMSPEFFSILGGVAAFLASFILALILCSTLPGRVFFTNWDQRLAGAVVLDDEDY